MCRLLSVSVKTLLFIIRFGVSILVTRPSVSAGCARFESVCARDNLAKKKRNNMKMAFFNQLCYRRQKYLSAAIAKNNSGNRKWF